MKNTLKYLFAMALAAAGKSAYAASGVIELEIPGMNEETAARIVDFRTNACPATVAALRDSIASNYDGVVLRKADYKALEEDPDGDGVPTWAEYIALTNPNDAKSRFNATIAIGADGVPVVGWNTQTSPSRTYKVFGKVDLSDSVSLEVNENAGLYRFFKVAVDLK